MTLKPKQQAFIDLAKSEGMTSPMSRDDMRELRENHGMSFPAWIMRDDSRRAGRGLYHVPELDGGTAPVATSKPKKAVAAVKVAPVIANPVPVVQGAVETVDSDMNLAMGMTGGERQSLVPSKSPEFVKWGHYSDIKKTIQSNVKVGKKNIFITGLSGNGKTFMVEQVCADLKRECYRVNITVQTDEDDLLGGFRLINGNTVWQDGPVTTALKTGGVLLLDEVDLGSYKMMCLQPVLEGKGVYLKKIGEWVTAHPNFIVIATANTKGRGDDTGKFAGTGIVNEAFLERFAFTEEQPYPSMAVEKKILTKAGCPDADFVENLCKWSDIIRKTYAEGAIDDIISTRRLVNIITAFEIFSDKKKALSKCLNRFDDDTKETFMRLYDKVDAETDFDADENAPASAEGNACPF
jgi:hypothetical protein